MDTNMVLNPGFNELVFENRHKGYGAYQIRKRYSKNVLLSAFFAVTFFFMAIGAYFINMPDANANGGPPVIYLHDSLVNIDGPVPPKLPTHPPTSPPPKGSTSTVTSNILIADSVPVTRNDSAVGVSIVIDGPGKTKDTASGGNPCPNCRDTTIEKTPRRVTWLPKQPKDPGLDAFFQKNINYPQQAIEQDIEGVVYLTFVVDTKGNYKEITILRGAHPLLDREVLRVAKLMPKWEPVKDDNGELVEYQYSKPIRFSLKK